MDDIGIHMNYHLGNYPSAKLKVDELFSEWLIAEGASSICSVLLDALSIAESAGDVDGDGATQRLLDTYRSPKKRSQAEMLKRSSSPPQSSPGNANSSNVTSATASPSSSSSSASNASSSSSGAGAQSRGVNGAIGAGTGGDLDKSAAATSASGSESGGDSPDSHSALRRRANFDTIPVFYAPGSKSSHLKRISEDDQLTKRLPEIEAFFRPFPGGIPVEKFVHVTKRLCGIPSFFNLPLCRRINEVYGDADCGVPPPRTIGRSGRHPSGVKIKLKTFLNFWAAEVEPYDRLERFFRVIKKHDAEYIFKDDFIPFLQELLHFHPGLDFLEAHEEFQRKYALTVITRIFYCVNTSRTGKLSLREVRGSNLFNACMHVDEETDINRVVEYFSYEHFYVLYCKFFELDLDKDSKLSRADLLKYGEHSLSEAIVDRLENTQVVDFTALPPPPPPSDIFL